MTANRRRRVVSRPADDRQGIGVHRSRRLDRPAVFRQHGLHDGDVIGHQFFDRAGGRPADGCTAAIATGAGRGRGGHRRGGGLGRLAGISLSR